LYSTHFSKSSFDFLGHIISSNYEETTGTNDFSCLTSYYNITPDAQRGYYSPDRGICYVTELDNKEVEKILG